MSVKIQRKPDAQPSIEIDNDIVSSFRYLGVQLENQLKWDVHIDKVKKKALRALGLIRHLYRSSKEVLAKTCRGLVEPCVN